MEGFCGGGGGEVDKNIFSHLDIIKALVEAGADIQVNSSF